MDAPPRIELKILRSFLCVARHRSFTRAARELGLTQPGISGHVHRLETALEVELIERAARDVRLTQAGRYLREAGERLMVEVSRVETGLERLVGGLQGRLHIGASTTPGNYLLPGILGRFSESHPHVELRCTVSSSGQVTDRVITGEIDVGIVGDLPGEAGVSHTFFTHDEIVVVAPAGHPLANRKNLKPKDLAGLPFILRERGSATRSAFEDWMAAARQAPEVPMELSSPEAILRMVQARMGLTAISHHAVDSLPAGLVLLPPMKPLIRRDLHIIHSERRDLGPVAQEFLDRLREEASSRRIRPEPVG